MDVTELVVDVLDCQLAALASARGNSLACRQVAPGANLTASMDVAETLSSNGHDVLAAHLGGH